MAECGESIDFSMLLSVLLHSDTAFRSITTACRFCKFNHMLGVCDEGHMQVYTWRVIRYSIRNSRKAHPVPG